MNFSFSNTAFLNFLRKLHALVGIFIGPFIIVAALTGALYAAAFSLENWMYKDILFTKNMNTPQSLNSQVEAADRIMKNEGAFFAIRPAAFLNETTRVLYTSPKLASSEYRTIFIDPNNLDIKADLITYGSGGSMPLRKTIDLIHRDLLLGKWGRFYSEVAASWLWITGLSGLFLYLRKTKNKARKLKNSYQKILRFHSYLGLFCFFALIMLSITGLTWSEWAGENISRIRQAMSWQTPGLDRKVSNTELALVDRDFDKIAGIARVSGIDASRIEIRPGTTSQPAWLVGEIDRGFPTQVDSIAINPTTLQVTSRVMFSDFPLMAKLTRWGIDLHMGSLFGLVNQIVLIFMALGISILGISGYLLWIKAKGWNALIKGQTLFSEFRQQPFSNKLIIFFITAILSLLMPLFFIGLVAMMCIEEALKEAFQK